MASHEIKQLLESLYIATGLVVRLYDEQFRTIMSFGKTQPLCLMTHSSEYVRAATPLITRCYGFDDECNARAREKGDVYVKTCPLGFYSATCPIYDSRGLVGFLQMGDMLIDTEEARQYALETALSYLPCEQDRILEKLNAAPCCPPEKLEAIPAILRAVCGYIELKDLFPTDEITLGQLIKQYVQQHLRSKLALSDIAMNLHCSTSTLTKTFRREYGITIVQYINQQRLEKASRLLSNTDLPIGTICEKCGFSGGEYFSALFKKTYGVSPLAHRRQERNTSETE